MDRLGVSSVSPAIASQRMCDLLLLFPGAAIGGVQWQTLLRKYKERYNQPLDIAALGHDTALAACTSVLWDVLRLENKDDIDNPVVAIEDAEAMIPRPGFLGCWPSLYKAFCEVVHIHGSPELETREGSVPHCLLLSKLKPLLQSHWHSNFTECGLNYLSEEGTNWQLKKMKHLVQAVLRWRQQYHKEVSRAGEVSEALAPQLELVPSKKHNDLVLRLLPVSTCITDYQLPASLAPSLEAPISPALQIDIPSAAENKRESWADVSEAETDALSECQTPSNCRSSAMSDLSSLKSGCSTRSVSLANDELEREIAGLRAENAALRTRNETLQRNADGVAMFKELFYTPATPRSSVEPEVFDDPFEPPPQSPSWSAAASPCPSDFGFGSGSLTPASVMSGSVTPFTMSSASHQAQGGFAALVPMWFSLGDRNRNFRDVAERIPSGIVQQAKALFERPDVPLPSFFVQN